MKDWQVVVWVGKFMHCACSSMRFRLWSGTHTDKIGMCFELIVCIHKKNRVGTWFWKQDYKIFKCSDTFDIFTSNTHTHASNAFIFCILIQSSDKIGFTCTLFISLLWKNVKCGLDISCMYIMVLHVFVMIVTCRLWIILLRTFFCSSDAFY